MTRQLTFVCVPMSPPHRPSSACRWAQTDIYIVFKFILGQFANLLIGTFVWIHFKLPQLCVFFREVKDLAKIELARAKYNRVSRCWWGWWICQIRVRCRALSPHVRHSSNSSTRDWDFVFELSSSRRNRNVDRPKSCDLRCVVPSRESKMISTALI